jgi:glycosyltransferase involved in cell wall biosynthesis
VKKQFEPPMNADSFVGFFIGVHRRLCFFTPSPGFCHSSQRIILAIVRIRFLTSTPLDVRRGSGTYVGISVLAGALERLGHSVHVETPHHRLPLYTLDRLRFNRSLRIEPGFDLTVGFDMDGYRIADSGAHVASLKGVIADEVRFERGLTKLTMSVQARCERLHTQRAARVIATSRYSAGRAREFYGLAQLPAVVPELIDLRAWKELLDQSSTAPNSSCFTVLFVGRFYRRKRIDRLLQAAALLRREIPDLEVRLVGNGPCARRWRRLAAQLQLGRTVRWLGDVTRAQLAGEYRRADAFCLPSVQEGFGIVLLEAMAAGKPIIAARAGAIPEVAPHAILIAPDQAEALAGGIRQLYRAPELRAAQAATGAQWVRQFDASCVAKKFLEAAGWQL